MDTAARSGLAARLGTDLVGGWCQLPGSATAELMGAVGFDFVCIDTQHGLIGDDALLPMLQALDATGTPALVRVAGNDPVPVSRALDRGAAGVIVPLVNSADEARRAVAACHYPPRGARSFGPTRVTWGARAAATADGAEPPVCIVMVETPAAVEAVPAILDVAGVDAVFVGPSDLALGAGLPTGAQHGDPDYDALLSAIVGPCRDRGVPVGIYSASADHVHRFRGLGFSFFALLSDASMLWAAATGHLRASRMGQAAPAPTPRIGY
ncbi:HpcH/HpaI aldolase family protein [Pseudonocardia bannensis]|uniref:2,4-dihydroxyhept-2-ene-1,7-dioic acid aldolase n=1 Tax=Pseudonocardia bannensis TaxID=630973 RepID=A0A848DKT1_9PSEU|nr:aldolase/citrate lyase family protein [Pseudonocardia bannensis]NMH93350.1 2,4-dihydroxyhept-2-ene-1,7-dioic acid aldolase [Pseudonocardia bannensis]